MVWRRGEPRGHEGRSRVFGAAPRGAVDERAALSDEGRQTLVLVDIAADRQDTQLDVRTIEPGDEELRLLKPEQRDDVVPDLGRGRGGKREHRRPAGGAVAPPAGTRGR